MYGAGSLDTRPYLTAPRRLSFIILRARKIRDLIVCVATPCDFESSFCVQPSMANIVNVSRSAVGTEVQALDARSRAIHCASGFIWRVGTRSTGRYRGDSGSGWK